MVKIDFRLNTNRSIGGKLRTLRAIRVRISLGYSTTIGGRTIYQPIELGTGCSVEEKQWDRERKRASVRADRNKGLQGCPDHQYINSTLDLIQERCALIASGIRQEEMSGTEVTYEQAKERYTSDSTLCKLRGQNTERRVVYTDGVFEFIASEIEARTNEDNTKRGRYNSLNRLKEFHEHISPNTPTYWENFNADYIERFRRYLQETGRKASTINKATSNAGVFHSWGVEAGKASELGKVTKLREEDSQKVYLKPYEVEALASLPLENGSTSATARDWFLIACGTGLRVSDLLTLTPEHLQASDIEGADKLIKIRTQKTKQEVIIPLIAPCVVQTLERLGWVFPRRLEPQTLNRFLKSLCQQAGITDPTEIMHPTGGRALQKWEAVTMHTARHTFATQALMLGIRPELVAEITGHKSLGVLDKHYNRQTQRDKVEAFVQAYNKSNNLK